MAMFLCVLCWSTSGLFIKQIDWHPMVISCIRSAIAAAFMATVHGRVMFARQAKPGKVPRLFSVSAFTVAVVASAATKILYVTANKMTSPVNAILLQHTAPLWAALMAGFLIGERIRRVQCFAVALAVCGISLFFFGSLGSGRLLGNGLALLAGISFALGMVALRSLKDASPVLALFFSHLVPVVIGLPFVFTAPPMLSAANIIRVTFLGLVQIGAASLLYAYAIRRLSAVNAMLISQLEPVFNPLWLFIFLGELPTRYALAGGLLIIAAAVISSIANAKANVKKENSKEANTKKALESEPRSAQRGAGFFPLFLPIAGKNILIIGGGTIALRRVQTLLAFDCRIQIIAEKLHEELEKIAAEHTDGTGAISIERRVFCPGDCIKGGRPFFVIAATNNRGVNHAVAQECAAEGIPVSVADCKEESTFYFPAVAIHDTIVTGISSGGYDHGAVRKAAATIREALKNSDNHTNRQP